MTDNTMNSNQSYDNPAFTDDTNTTTTDKSTDKSSDKSTNKSTDKSTDKSSDNSTDDNDDKVPEISQIPIESDKLTIGVIDLSSKDYISKCLQEGKHVERRIGNITYFIVCFDANDKLVEQKLEQCPTPQFINHEKNKDNNTTQTENTSDNNTTQTEIITEKINIINSNDDNKNQQLLNSLNTLPILTNEKTYDLNVAPNVAKIDIFVDATNLNDYDLIIYFRDQYKIFFKSDITHLLKKNDYVINFNKMNIINICSITIDENKKINLYGPNYLARSDK